MRTILFLVILITSIEAKAQTSLPVNFMDYVQRNSFGNTLHYIDRAPGKKWFVSSYSGIATSFNFFNGGYATVLGVPMGLQLNHRLTNNWYAFAGVSVMPAYINFNHSFISPDINKLYPNNGLFRSNSLDIYSKAELGLMYVNDSRTFSISGSFGVERSSYPILPYQQTNQPRPTTSTRSMK